MGRKESNQTKIKQVHYFDYVVLMSDYYGFVFVAFLCTFFVLICFVFAYVCFPCFQRLFSLFFQIIISPNSFIGK